MCESRTVGQGFCVFPPFPLSPLRPSVRVVGVQHPRVCLPQHDLTFNRSQTILTDISTLRKHSEHQHGAERDAEKGK